MGMVMAICLLGDSLLYVALPASAAELGLPLWSVGVLLAANRVVRLVTNTWVAALVRRHGGRRPLLLATALAAGSTMSYGLVPWFWPFLAARLIWGWCFSALRLNGLTVVMAASEPRTRGHTLGVYRSLSRLGNVVSLLAGALVLEAIGFRTTFVILGVLTLAAIPLARTIGVAAFGRIGPVGGAPAPPGLGWQARWFGGRRLTAVKLAGLAHGFATQGVAVSTFALVAAAALGKTEGAALLAGLVVAGRWGVDVLLAPLFGRLSDRLDRGAALVALLAGQALLLLAIGAVAGWLAPGTTAVAAAVCAALLLFVTGTAYGIVADAAAGDLIPEERRAEMLSGYADWLDIGSAAGPLLAFVVADAIGLGAAYALAAAAILAAAANVGAAWCAGSATTSAD